MAEKTTEKTTEKESQLLTVVEHELRVEERVVHTKAFGAVKVHIQGKGAEGGVAINTRVTVPPFRRLSGRHSVEGRVSDGSRHRSQSQVSSRSVRKPLTNENAFSVQ
jgi:hypothetical protein